MSTLPGTGDGMSGYGHPGEVPFTVAHLAAVLPLRSGRTRVDALPTAPLVISAMVPDLPAVLGASDLRPLTHTGPYALPVDLLLTALLWGCWVLAVRPAVVASLPEVAARWRPRSGRRPVVAWWVAAAVLGAASHVVWDAFTHSSDGSTWFGGFAVHQRFFLALQLLSSAAGLVAVLLWAGAWWLRTPVAVGAPSRVAWTPGRIAAAAVVVLSVVVAGLWRWQHPAAAVRGRASHSLQLGDIVFGMLEGVLVAGVLLTAAFWVLRWVRTSAADDTAVDRLPTT